MSNDARVPLVYADDVHPLAPLATEAALNSVKREAKRMSRDQGITHAQALNIVAARYGFRNWALLMRTRTRRYYDPEV